MTKQLGLQLQRYIVIYTIIIIYNTAYIILSFESRREFRISFDTTAINAPVGFRGLFIDKIIINHFLFFFFFVLLNSFEIGDNTIHNELERVARTTAIFTYLPVLHIVVRRL